MLNIKENLFLIHRIILSLLLAEPSFLLSCQQKSCDTIFAAIERSDYNQVQLFLKNGLKVDNERMEITQQTPLHRAVDHGDLAIIHLLISYGANISARDAYDNEPISYAVKQKNAPLVKFFLDRGASPIATCLMRSLKSTIIHQAIENSDPEIVHLLLAYGAHPDTPMPIFSFTPLHLIAWRALDDKTEVPLVCARELIAYGANVNAKDYKNNTPLENASKAGFVWYAKFLLDNGAHVNTCSEATPLQMAALAGSSELVYLLLTRGANPALRGHLLPGNATAFLPIEQYTTDTMTRHILEQAEIVRDNYAFLRAQARMFARGLRSGPECPIAKIDKFAAKHIFSYVAATAKNLAFSEQKLEPFGTITRRNIKAKHYEKKSPICLCQ